jgi:hypothetical protein
MERNETDAFYETVSTRISCYVNLRMSLHPHPVEGDRHATKQEDEGSLALLLLCQSLLLFQLSEKVTTINRPCWQQLNDCVNWREPK